MDQNLTNTKTLLSSLLIQSNQSPSELYEIALTNLQNPQSLEHALLIFNQIPQEHQNIYSILHNKFINFLLDINQDIQNLTFDLISNLINYNYNFESLQTQVIESLLNIIRWDITLNTPQQGIEYTNILLNSPFPDLINLIKIIEPISFIKYYFINKEGINISGLLKTLELFLSNENSILNHTIELIEITQRVARHQNEQVRSYALKFIHYLAKFYDNKNFKELIHATLLAGLMDESLDIRVQAMIQLKTINPKDKDQLLLLLYKNSHCEDLKNVSEIVIQQLFPNLKGSINSEFISIINEKKINEFIMLCFYSTISRNWRIRRSGLKTLQSIIQFYYFKDLPIIDILKVAQNCTLLEIDFEVKYNGFQLMYQIVSFYQNKITEFKDQIIQNCLFHLSDGQQECQLLCSKILINLIDQQNSIIQLQSKLNLVTNFDLAQKDLEHKNKIIDKIGNQFNNQIAQQEINEENIIKHQENIFIGILAGFIQMMKLKFDEQSLQQVSLMIYQGFKFGMFKKENAQNYLINELKSIQIQQKELVKKLIIHSNLVDILKDLQLELISTCEELNGTSILKE